MSLLLRVATLVMLGMLTAVPALHAAGMSPAAGLPYRHSDFDFTYAWKTSPLGQGVAIDGMLRNVRYYKVEGVVLTVSLLNRDEKVVADVTTFPIPQRIGMYDTRPFDVVLKNVALSPGDRLRFLIHYSATDGRNGTGFWLSSFTVDAATGATLVDKVKPAEEW